MSQPHRDPPEPTPHLTVEEVVGYVHGSVPPHLLPWVEEHLADCDPCRDEVALAVRSGRRGSGPRARRWIPWAAAAAVAGVIGVAVLQGPGGPGWPGGSGDEPRFRDAPRLSHQEGILALQVLEPADGGTVVRDRARFAWTAAEAGAFYRFTLTDLQGDVLLRRDLADTVLVLGPDAPLLARREYFWYVDTLLKDGRSATTDVRRIRVAPPGP